MAQLVELARHPKVIAIGETGLTTTGCRAIWNGSANVSAPISAPHASAASR